jgi:tripartite-type tricarboxylate transporter receptor subunit TctC
MQGLLAEQVHLVFIDVPPVVVPNIRSGRLRALALVAPQRSPALPEVPTVAKAGSRTARCA